MDGDPDALAAGHHAAVVGALPWESAWMAADGRLGSTDEVRAAYADGGFAPGDREEPDHVGLELAFLAHLCAAEAEGLEDGVDVRPIVDRQRGSLDQHLGRWLPALVLAVREAGSQGGPRWWSWRESWLDHAPAPWELAGRLPDLADPELGLMGIARALVTPARSGWLPTEPAFDRIAARVGVPSGFGDRVGRMSVILRSGGAGSGCRRWSRR